jgi:sigma-B regulation protein RsbU (phosphoserine phosphatase)
LAEVCRRVNQFLVKRTSPERYATFFVGRLSEEGCLEYVNAGHNPPMLRRENKFLRLEGGGMPLGLFADATYEQHRIDLSADDLILTYTDGVTESMNRAEEEFGESRLKEAIGQNADGGARRVLDAVLAAVDTHTGGADQFDDLTLLVLRWSRNKEGTTE